MNANSTLPNEIEKFIGKTFMLQLKLNDYNWKDGWELYTIEKGVWQYFKWQNGNETWSYYNSKLSTITNLRLFANPNIMF